MATATSILVPVILRSPHLYRTQAAAVVIGVLMPWLMNAMYVLDLSPYPRLNLMPFSFFFYAVAVGWALVRLRFLDVVPIARDGVVEGLQEAVLVFGMNGQIAAANPPAAGLLGRSARELVSLELSDLLASVSAALDPSKPVPAEHEIVVGDAGSSRVFELRVAGVNDHRGRPRGRVAVFHDLTDRKRAEEEQVGSQRLLAAGELAAGIAHNLNNILVGILAPAQRLQDGQTTELSRDAGIIVSAAERARDLVERLNCGTDWERPVRLESVDVAAVTAEVIEAARPRWEEVQTAGGQIVVSSQLGILLPARCDRTELHDAILNLILNAVDAMPEGGQVTIAAEVDQKNVILTVSDTGTGMDSETLRRAFEPFFTTKVNIGTGLGLSTVYRSVQHWDGDISATSQPGEGTTFRLALPLWEGAPDASAPQLSGEARATQILIAEDEAIVAMVLADYVRSEGHNVDIVGDGAEALEQLSRGDVDVAILDLGIPRYKGDEVALQVREQNPNLTTVLMTGWAHRGTRCRHECFAPWRPMTEGKIHLRPRYHRWHVDPGVEWVESNTSHAHLQWTFERRHCALVLLDVWNQHYLKDTQARAEGIVQQRLLPLVAASRQAGLPIVHAPSPNQAKETRPVVATTRVGRTQLARR